MISPKFPDTRVFVFDLDGVLYRGAQAVENAADALTRLRAAPPEANIRLFFLTNNSTQTRGDYVAKLTHLGMPCDEAEVVTSASATADYLVQTHHAAGKTALVVGGDGLRDELKSAGLRAIHASAGEAPNRGETIDFVVVGLDRVFTYQTLYMAQQALLTGAAFVATNRDGQFPVENGKFTPGGGAMVAAIAACTDKEPIVIGKPETLGLETILARAHAAPSEALMIGDRLDTDVLCGNRIGVPTLLVMTGVTSHDQLRNASPEMTPTFVLRDLSELF